MLPSTIHMTTSKIRVLPGAYTAPTVEQCNPHLTAHEMSICTTRPVCLWGAHGQEAKLRLHPFTIVPHMMNEEYARDSLSISCPPSTLRNTTTLPYSVKGSTSPRQGPSALALLLDTRTVALNDNQQGPSHTYFCSIPNQHTNTVIAEGEY